jgi:uncharacterized membrane protein HdeD (DUF308 family)
MGQRPIRPGRLWWIPAIRGVVAMLLGGAVLFLDTDRAMLANFIGIYWLVSGVLTLRWASSVRWRRGSHLAAIAGVVGVIASLMILLRHPLQHVVSSSTLLALLGVAAALTGALRLIGAFEIEQRTGRRWTLGGFALGAVEVALGIILFTARSGNLRAITIVAVIWGFVGGALLLAQGLRLRQLGRTSPALEL